MKTAFIYSLADPTTYLIRYIGKTDNPKSRLKDHLKCDRSTHTSSWIKNLKVSGLKPIMEIVEEIKYIDDQEWEEAERYWISMFKFWGFDLTNHDSGGNSGKSCSQEHKDKIASSLKGRKRPEEVRAKLRISLKGNKNHKGHKHSDKSKLKMSASCKGKRLGIKLSEETKRKISIASIGNTKAKGFKHSEETKKKMSEARRRWTISPETRLKMSKARKGKKFDKQTHKYK